MKNLCKIIFLSYLFCILLPAQLPDDFIYADELIKGIKVELRYLTENNFIGKPINGYKKNRLILTNKAAYSLKKVQEELKLYGLEVKIFDAYRPQKAVDNFVKWAKDLEDTIKKSSFYPEIDKKDLFKLGYIASKSGHSRGSVVDLTIISSKSGEELDMGYGYDYFSVKSWISNLSVTEQQRANRLLLKTLMEKYGFEHYPQEWWHFKLRNEPFPDTYFDFDVE